MAQIKFAEYTMSNDSNVLPILHQYDYMKAKACAKFVRLSVIKLDTSISVNCRQYEKALLISVTLDVSQPVVSIAVIFIQPLNISYIDVIVLVKCK